MIIKIVKFIDWKLYIVLKDAGKFNIIWSLDTNDFSTQGSCGKIRGSISKKINLIAGRIRIKPVNHEEIENDSFGAKDAT